MNHKIEIHQIVNTIYSSNTFVFTIDGANDSVWLVDCGDIGKIVDIIDNRQVIAVFLTHTHYDHIYGINDLIELYPNAVVYTNQFGKEALLSPKLNHSKYHQEVDDFICQAPQNIVVISDNQMLPLHGKNVLTTYETPGHDDSCITYVLGENVFSGDSFIPGFKVYSNFKHGDKQKAAISKNIIIELSKGKSLFPGHGRTYEI